jgi:hypothetical protein
LGILALQQRKRADLGAILGGRAILHQGFAGNMKLLEFGERITAGGASFQFEDRAQASGHSVYFGALADIISALAKAEREGVLREKIRFFCRFALLIGPDAGPAAPSFAADGPASGRLSTCRLSSPHASTLT